MRRRIKITILVILFITIGIVAITYLNNFFKERKVQERKAILEDLGFKVSDASFYEEEDAFLEALESVDQVSIDKLNEENHKRIEYGINHMPMLKNINIYFRDIREDENDIELEYFNDFDLKDKTVEVFLSKVDDKSLAPLGNIGHISQMTVTGYNYEKQPVNFKGLNNVSKLVLIDEKICEKSFLGDMTNLEKLTIQNAIIDGFGDLSKLKKLHSVKINASYSDDKLEDAGLVNNLAGLETLDHEITIISDVNITQNIVNGLKNVKISTLKIDKIDKNFDLDLSVLENCKRLELCNIGSITNEIIEDISCMVGLEELELSGDIQIDNYTGLNNLQTLNTLEISQYKETPINLSTIPQLTKIKSLSLYGAKDNCISDISVLGEMYWLEELDITGSQRNVSDISILSNMPNLKRINLSGTGITDISVLSNIPDLEQLDISITDVSDISVLANMSALKSLDISGTHVSDISVLSNISTLEQLYLAGTEIADLSVLPQLINLKTLSLASMDLSDASALSGLKNLESLNLQNSSISDYSFLADLTNLKELNLEGSSISNLDAVAGMNDLEILNISDCRIKDISALDGKEKLTCLDISETDVDDISALNMSKELVNLDISGTTVNEFSPLKDMSKLKSIKAEDTDLRVIDWLPVRNVDEILPYFDYWNF